MTPITRREAYLAYIAGEYSGELPAPVTREEQYLYDIAVNGGGGGGGSGDVTGVKGAENTTFKKGNVTLSLDDIVKLGNGLKRNSTTNTLEVEDLTAAQTNAIISLLN